MVEREITSLIADTVNNNTEIDLDSVKQQLIEESILIKREGLGSRFSEEKYKINPEAMSKVMVKKLEKKFSGNSQKAVDPAVTNHSATPSESSDDKKKANSTVPSSAFEVNTQLDQAWSVALEKSQNNSMLY